MPDSRGLRAEEEINLYYWVVGKKAFLQSALDVSSPISVHKQLEQGRKHLLVESLRVFEEAGDWDNIYQLCEFALTRDDENGRPSFLAFDMRVWKAFTKAATMKSNVEEYVPLCFLFSLSHPMSNLWNSALAKVTSVLDRFVAATNVPPMYKKNMRLVSLELAFQGPSSVPSGIGGFDIPSSRVIVLFLVIEQGLFLRAAFDDVKQYVGQLTFEEAKYFIDNFSKILLGKVSSFHTKCLVKFWI